MALDPVLIAVLGLAGAIALGALASRSGALGDRDAAIAVLNALGIRVAFPALVLVAVARAPNASEAPATWLVGPLAVVLVLALVAVVRRVSRRVRDAAGSIALVVAFGNVAYLGMPLATALLGEEHASTAALAATAHVAVAVTAGPLLLGRWSGQARPRSLLRVAMQPLFLALVAGLALRLVPALARDLVLAAATPIGSVAAPVGAFVLGAYLERHRALALRAEAGTLLSVAARLVLVPAVALALVHALVASGAMPPAGARLAVLLAAMPAAISTFAIAHDEGHGAERAAGAIVVSSLLSALTVPVWLALAP